MSKLIHRIDGKGYLPMIIQQKVHNLIHHMILQTVKKKKKKQPDEQHGYHHLYMPKIDENALYIQQSSLFVHNVFICIENRIALILSTDLKYVRSSPVVLNGLASIPRFYKSWIILK